MSVNCSSSNGSLPSAAASSSSHLLMDYTHHCFKMPLGRYMIATFTVASVVGLLPVYVLVLRLGFQQWRRRRPGSAAVSHFDLFTHHMVLVELLNVAATLCTCYGIYADAVQAMVIGSFLLNEGTSAQLFFHILTCADRYLAVVHPVTYLRLKGEKWNRARHGIVAFVWLLSVLATAGVLPWPISQSYAIVFVLTALEMSLILVFSLSVLRVLIRSGPADRGEGRKHVEPSKLKAFYVLVGVLVALVARLSWNIISGSFVLEPNICKSGNCGFLALIFWISLPTSLLMPLLYLQRKWRILKRTRQN